MDFIKTILIIILILLWAIYAQLKEINENVFYIYDQADETHQELKNFHGDAETWNW